MSTSVDDQLRKIRERGFKLSMLQQTGDGMWQAALRRGGEEYMPAVCMTAVDALEEALMRSTDGRLVAWKTPPEQEAAEASDPFA